MNEQFRKLAEQAFFDEVTSQSSDKMYNFSDHKMQKFAELIVQECASMARVYCSNDFDLTGDLELDEFMLKHFGVI